MSQLENPRHEAFAQARARNVARGLAYAQAGFNSPARNAHRLAKNAKINERITEIREDLPWGGSSDLAPVIRLLADAAKRAVLQDTPAAFVAARGLLSEVAKLKIVMGDAHAPRHESTSKVEPMSNAEWLAMYAPHE